MNKYETVGDYLKAKIPSGYWWFYCGFGEWERTDVKEWIRETFLDPEHIIARDFLNEN